MAQPSVAVVGGGIAGTLCSLVLRNRGARPRIFDAGKHGVGGRLRGSRRGDGGTQFLRAADPRLGAVMRMLEREGLVSQWTGRFGMLGTKGGGFLPSQVVGTLPLFNDSSSNASGDTSITRATASDGGDFCGFVTENRVTTYVGMPRMLDLCPRICQMAGIDIVQNARVISVEPVQEGGWRLIMEGSRDCDHDDNEIFDALVLATHDPSLASSSVRSIATNEADAAASSQNASTDDGSISSRLLRLADALQSIRDTGKMPVYALSVVYPKGFSENVDFDAVSVHGSPTVQFLARDASKPGRQSLDSGKNGDLWTAISTSHFAGELMAQNLESEADARLTEHLSQLFAPSFGGDASRVPEPLDQSTKLWRAGFNSASLDLLEDSIALAPWRLAISGEFVSKSSAHATPFEAAALSGLEAGERVSAFFN